MARSDLVLEGATLHNTKKHQLASRSQNFGFVNSGEIIEQLKNSAKQRFAQVVEFC